jgi:hypothetical protein
MNRAVPKPGCGAEWLDMLHTGYVLLRAGLRRELGPEGDVDAAYRQWYEKQMQEHHELVARSCERLHRVQQEQPDAA